MFKYLLNINNFHNINSFKIHYVLNFTGYFYLLDKALSDDHILFKPILSFSNIIGRLTKILNAIKAKESVVNLATPHSDEARAKIDSCMNL